MGTDNDRETEFRTILVAEDILSNYLLVKALLKNSYNLVHANNGQEALEILHRQPVDLVLMDMKMPVMGGYETTVRIREFDLDIPIIALTAHAFDADRSAALKAGCNEYLIKPLDRVLLMATIEKYIAAREATTAETKNQ